MRAPVLALAFISFSLVTSSRALAQTYSLAKIGTLGGSATSYGASINASGQVTGYSFPNAGTAYHAFIEANGALANLGTLTGSYSSGEGINAAGRITGRATIAGDTVYHAVISNNGILQDLGTLTGNFSSGQSINASGQVTGYATTADDSAYHAFLYSGGVMTDLLTLPGGSYSSGRAINASGQITGYSTLSGGSTYHAFLYSGGLMKDLLTLPGGSYSAGEGINAKGEVTGRSYVSGNAAYHAFIYSDGVMTDLSTLGGTNSSGQAINTAGQVVGYSDTGNGTHAFLYSSGKMVDLNNLIDPSTPLAPYVTLSNATAITDSGYILALGNDSQSNSSYWFILQENAPVTVSTRTIGPGQTATLSVAALGSGPFTYQWFVGTTGNTADPVTGAVAATFTTPPLSVTTSYWVKVTGPNGNQVSSTVTINVEPPPTVTLKLASPIIIAAVDTTFLTWSSVNAQSCIGSSNWPGTKPTSGSVPVTGSVPGYFTYSLTCTGIGGTTTQSVVLTVAGSAPSYSTAQVLEYLSSFNLPPPNFITALQTTLAVPPLPPVPTNPEATLFLWPGLEPDANSVNFLPINEGVLQSVLTWGPSCAPTRQPTPFSSWWISAQYVNTVGDDAGYEGCQSGTAMLVNPGDSLSISMELLPRTSLPVEGVWRQTVTDLTTNQSVSFNLNMGFQGQNSAYFAIEAYYGETLSLDSTVLFYDTTISYASADTTGACSEALGAANGYVMTPPTPQNSNTQCFISAILMSQ